MNIPFVDLSAQYASISDDVEAAIAGTLKKSDFILGQNVSLFEEEFADFCDARYGIGVDSGTSALELALRAYNIGPGDEVITQANTFIATALAISFTGAKPVLTDVNPISFMMDPEQVERAITPRTKAIIPVHLYGHPADMDPIMEIAEKYGLIVIEDASQAHGARYNGQRVGAIGHVGAFSLYPGKNLGAYGDAGVIVTNDPAIDKQLRLLRNWGSVVKYHHEIQGFNRRLDTLQASVLRVKLPHLDDWNAARRRNAQLYTRLLSDSKLVLPAVEPYAEPVFHLYVVRTKQRAQLMACLGERGITTIIHYPLPIHLQPAYAELGYQKGDFPITEMHASQILSLPMFAELTPDQIEYVVAAIHDYEADMTVETRVPELVAA
ncbi:MAG: DegT/DnrJ/EryC1/StrS family aminotransferase [Caldilineaceae bacterium]